MNKRYDHDLNVLSASTHKNMFGKEKSAFDIPELKNPMIERVIKNAVQDSKSTYSVPTQILNQISSMGSSYQACAIILTQILRVFDELGSHSSPVYKSLVIMISCLQGENKERFIQVGRALVPEIQTVLYLSFDEIHPAFRDEIHLMASAIYDFLMYEVPLPEINEFNTQNRIRNKVHRPTPPPEFYADVKLLVFGQETDEDELPFDPRAAKPKIQRVAPSILPPPVVQEPPEEIEDMLDLRVPPEPVVSKPELIDFTVKQAEVQPPEKIMDAPDSQASLDNRAESVLGMISELRTIRKLQYDDMIESC